MINAGAIATAGLVSGKTPQIRLKRLMEITADDMRRRSRIVAELDRLRTLEVQLSELRARIERLETSRPS